MMKFYFTSVMDSARFENKNSLSIVKRFVVLILFFLFSCTSIFAQQFVNGNLSTGTLNSVGVVAPTPFSWSEVQLGNGNPGNNATPGQFFLADNFNVCANWAVSKFTFYAYVTDYASPTVSPINDVKMAIYDVDPSVGAPTPVFGDLTTNRFSASTPANIYRVFNGQSLTNRQVWNVEVNTPALSLTPGNYWVVFSIGNTVTPAAPTWVPLSTVVGTLTQPGNNAKSRTAAGVWSNITDPTSTTAQDLPFIIDYTAGACSGAPTPGATNASAAGPICPSVNFTLSLTNPDCQTGISFQWQYSTDGVTWNNIAGATQSTLTTNFSTVGISNTVASPQFRARVTCANGGSVANSGAVSISQNAISNCYCPSSATSTIDEEIENVTIGAFSNNSLCTQTAPGPGSVASRYSNFTTLPTGPTISSGIPNSFSIRIGDCENSGFFTSGVGIWIDYNFNGIFETTEQVFLSPAGINGIYTVTGTITVPAGITGQTVMRIVNRETPTMSQIVPCGTYGFGETEDYLVTLVPPQACTSLTAANLGFTASSVAQVCPGVNFNLSTPGTAGFGNITYQWYSSPTGTVGSYSLIAGATSATYTTSLSAATFYQCQIFCSGTAIGFTTPVQIQVSPIANCYCVSSSNSTIDEDIDNVTIGSFSNSSTCTQVAPGPGSIASRYSNFTTLAPITIFAGIDNPFSVSVTDCEGTGFFTSGVGIWIDLNNNAIFEASEQVFLSAAGISGPYIASGNINVPSTSSFGIRRMRIVNRETPTMSQIVPCGTYGFGETEDYLVNVQSATPCTSAGLSANNLGNTLTSTPTVCPNINFDLSLESTFGYQGITYQWQSSLTGAVGSFVDVPVGGTPITSGTQSNYTTSLTATTFYQCQIFCNGTLVGATSPVQVVLAPPTQCYCIPTSGCASLDDILNVTIGTINNSSTAASDCVTSGYVDYTSITPATVFLGVSNPISVTVNAGGQESAGAWIDYNFNGTFETSEFTLIGTGASSTTPLVFTNFINIPVSATTGIVRMRVRSKFGSSVILDTEACTPFQFGQTEDYLVNIIAATACDNTYNPGTTISTSNPVCPSVPFTLSVSNTSPISGLQFQWQSSPTGAAGSWTDIAGAINVTLQTTQTAATFYRANVFCQASGRTTPSTSLQVTMTPSNQCYCIPPPSTCTAVNITNLNFAGINNTSNCSTNGYINYTGTVAPGIAISGASNPIIVSGTGSRFTSVWIDYNRNGIFDATEFTSLGFTSAASISGNIVIPTTALSGQTLMRVRNSSVSPGSTGSCSSIVGETEDYQINILACSAVQFEGTLANQTTTCLSNASFNAVQLVTSTVSPNETYQWQVKTSPTGSWVNIANGPSGLATYSGATTGILNITSAPLSFNGYEYRVYVNGNCSVADTITPAKLFVTTSSNTVISTQPPVNVSVGCANNINISFVATTGPNPVYQWQVRANATSPWINLVNGVNGSTTIAGVTTTTLSLTYITNSYNGYQFRAYLSSPCALSDTTGISTLTVNPIVANLTMVSNAPSNTLCNGASVTFTSSLNFSGAPSVPLTANNTSSGTTIFVASTTGLTVGQYVTVNSGTGAFAINTQIVSPITATSFTVSQAPTTPITSGASIGAYNFGFKFFVNNVLLQNGVSNIFTTNTLTNGSEVRCTVLLNDPTSCVPVNPASSPTLTMTVTPNTPVSVAIASSLGNTICSGDNVTFTATPTNGGAAPTYQWRRNSNNIPGATASTYSTTTLLNTDIITVVMTSNIAANLCGSPNPATSNAITMTVNPSFPVSVSIAASPGVSSCPGLPVTFTATPTNGGTTPAYQWFLNNNPVGTNSATYTSTTLVSGDQIKCVLTSSITSCTLGSSPATSNILTMSISTQTASVSISQVPRVDSVCAGSSVTYTANPVNGGGSPSYQFYVNGVAVGNTGNTYTYIPGANDSVSVAMTSSFACASPNPATNFVIQTLKARPTASVTNANLVCSNTAATLDAGATAGSGTISSYQWSLGGVAQPGATQSTYFSTTAGNYTVTVTNSFGCVFTSPSFALSFGTLPAMQGNYTIGAITATASGANSTTTINVNSTANLTVGALVSVVSGTGLFAPNTIITAINSPTQFTVNITPTTNLALNTVIAGATCTNYTSFRTAFADLNSRSIAASCLFNVSAGYTETLAARTATANAASASTTINVASTANMYVGAVPYVSTGTGVFAPGTYITAINSNGTQFTVSAAPTAALVSGDVISITRLDLGSSFLNPTIGTTRAIVFQKSGSGANPLVTAYTGTGSSLGNTGSAIPDGMIALLGVDSVTFDGINLIDNNTTNTAAMMEYGYGLFRLTTTDGAQRNTIKNCNISLNNANFQVKGNNVPEGSIGILVVADTVFKPNDPGLAGGISGANSNNRFYSNTITKCNYGIAFSGFGSSAVTSPATPTDADVNNDVGGATTATGNTITNFGNTGTTLSAGGIYANNQWNMNMSNNTITSGNHGGALRGIFGVAGPGANVSINNNIITLTDVGTTVNIFGIDNAIGTTASNNTVNISNNSVSTTYSSATSGNSYAIHNTAICTNLNMNGNSVLNNTFSSTAALSTGAWFGVFNNVSGCLNVSMNNNTVSGNTINTASTAAGSYVGTLGVNATGTPTVSISGNTVTSNTRNVSAPGISTSLNLLNVSNSTNGIVNANNNVLTDNTINIISGTTANVYSLFSIFIGADSINFISNNTIRNNGININVSTATGAMSNWGINTSQNVFADNIFNNSIRRLFISTTNATASTANQSISGIYTSSGFLSTVGRGNKNYYGNIIDSLFTNSTYNGLVVGIRNQLGGTNINLYKNKISALLPGQSATAAVSQAIGIRISSTAQTSPITALSTNINNNMIALNNTHAINNGSATTDAIRGIDLVAITANMTYRVYNNTIRISGSSTGTNFGSAALSHNIGASGAGTLDLRNNILVNESTPTGTGLAIAFRRSANNFGNDSTVCNNNILWAGSPQSTPRWLYFDGTNNVAALPFPSATFGTRETNSKSFLPAFVSATDLHINSCDASSTTTNFQGISLPSITDDIDNETRSLPVIGADEFSANSFAGAVTSNVSVCSGTNSGTFTLTGSTGTIVRWESSTDSTTWTPIANTTTTQSFSNLTVKTWYRAVVSNGSCGTANSLNASVSIFALPQISTTAAAGPYVTTANVCVGASIQLYGTASAAFANPWVSATTANATINTTTGVAVGITAGTSSVITYTNTNGCQSTLTLNVSALPTAITGPSSVCIGSTITLSGTSAVSWSSTNTAVATISATGVVTPVGAGTTNITYTNAGGCTSAVYNITVNVRPTITAGLTSLCVGGSGTLAATTTPAASPWLSSDPTIASITNAGFISGVAAGTVNITFTNTNGCVSANYPVTINTAPTVTPVTTTTVCVGSTITLTGSATPQSLTATTPWQSSNTGVATVANTASTSGVITGVAAGSASITYTNNNGCAKTTLITVNPRPTQFSVTGTGSYCSGGTGLAIGLGNSQAGVNYQLVRTVGAPTGNVGSPVSGNGGAISFGTFLAGTYTVTATDATTGCTNTMTGSAVITTSSAPTISGSNLICIGNTTPLTGSTTGAAVNPWVSTNNAVATVDNSGLVTAISAGTTDIIFTNSNGCPSASFTITVNPLSVGGTVSGDTTICSGSAFNRTFTLTGNVGSILGWETSTNGFATFSALGTTASSITIAAPSVTTQYRVRVQSSGCAIAFSSLATITVNPIPVVTGVAMTGGGAYCSGSNGVLVGLTGSTAGINYQLLQSSTNIGTPIAGNGSAISFGFISGAGTYTAVAISSNGCRANIAAAPNSVLVTVNPLPTVSITQQGPINICSPATQSLTTSSGSASTFQWFSFGVAIPGATSPTYTVTGAGSNLLSVQVANSTTGCSSLKSRAVVVNINTAPTNLAVTPDTSDICAGSTQSIAASSLTASGNALAMAEDFNDTARVEWEVISNGASPLASNWKLYSTPYNNTTGSATFRNFTTQDGGWFALADADAGGFGSTTLSELRSDTFSLANYTSASLTFEHAYRYFSGDQFAQVEISTDNGNTWNDVLFDYWGTSVGTTTSNAQTTVNENLPLTPYLGQSNLMIRFYYESDWGYYWLVDNVKVSGLKQYPTSYTWTPATGLNTTSGSTVIAGPPTNTNYVVTATSSAGCFVKDTAVVNIKLAPVVITQPRDTTVCAGSNAPTLSTSASGIGTISYQWYSNTTNSNTGGTIMLGQIADTLVPSVSTAGTTYYYAVVEDIACNLKDTSRAAAVTVSAATAITTEPIAPTNVCLGGTAPTLNVVASGNGLTYQWYSNTSNSNTGGTLLTSATAASYVPSIATAGTAYYYVVVSGNCGSDTSVAVAVVVNTGSSAAVLSGTATITLGNSTNLQVAITGGTSPYTVVYSDGTSNFTVNNYTSGSNISVSPTATTTYTLVSVTSAAGCVGTGNSGTAVVTVNSASTAAVLSAVAPTTICIGATANLQVAITGGISPFTIVYSDGTTNFTVNNYLTGTNIPVTPTVTTTYQLVSVTSTGGFVGTGNTGTPAITVTPLNTVTLTSAAGTNSQTICQGSAITTITYATIGATGATFSGLPAGLTSGWVSNVVTISGTPSATGTFNYTVTLTGGCGTITATGTITVTPGNSGPLAAGTYFIPKRTCTDFNTIAEAVSYLNTNGIANTPGNWIFKVDSNYVETLTSTLALGNATLNSGINGVSATKRITFSKNGVGNNPKVIAHTGTAASFNTPTPDGIWSLRGVDYVTIDGIDLQDNNTTGNAMMEYGYGLFKTSATDGAQNDTIRNCTITLNRNNVVAGNANTLGGSVGIAVLNVSATSANGTATTATSAAGANSNNKFIANTIQNVNTGIGISGSALATAALFADSGNGIGDSTLSNSGNRIINFGGGTSAAIPSYGVYLLNQVDAVVAYNEINNRAGGTGVDHVSSQYGIETIHATGTTGIGIKANNVTISGGANSNYYGIDNNVGGAAGSTVNIVLNNVSVKIPSVATTNTVGSITGIKNANPTPVTTININGNTFKGSVITGTGAWTAVQNTGSATGTGVVNMNNNIVDSNAVQTTGTMIALQNNGSAYQTLNVNNNTISRNSKSVSSATATDFGWLNIASSAGTINVQGNLLEKDSVIVLNTNTSAVTSSGIKVAGTTTGNTFTVSGNTVRNLSIQSINSTHVASLKGYASNIPLASTATENVNSNKISGLYIVPASGSSALHNLYGIHSQGNVTGGNYAKSIYANAVDTLYIRNNADATPLYNSLVAAIYNSGTANGNNINIYKNKIAHIIPFGTSSTTIGRGIWLGSIAAGATTSKAYIYNNMVNMDLTEAFDGASNGSILTAADGIRGIDLSQTTADSTFLYFNTVRIAGAGNPTSSFGSSAASITTNTTGVVLTLRNNIFVNKSTAGSTGFAVALRRAGTTAIYNTVSSNNLFYVDTTGRRAMYYEGAVGFNTLSGAWTAGSRELNSITQVEPVFVKALDGTDSLHLDVNTNCAMNTSGVAITLPAITDDIDGTTRGTPPDMGADEFEGVGLGIGQWAGVNTNWNDQLNWCGLVPASNTDITIPSSRANYPSINNTTLPVPMCRNIVVNTGAIVNVLSGGKLQIFGNTSSGGGSINAKDGTIEFAGTTAQTIGASTFQNNNVRNITINSAGGVTLNGQLYLLNKLGFSGSNRTFNIGDSLLHMKSSDTLTAFLANINKDANTGAVVSGNTVIGNTVVERFISLKRAWRLLSMPTSHNAQTIKMAWQEGATLSSQNPKPGYGIQITSNISSWVAAGFDTFSVAGPSVKVYNPSTNAYDGLLSTTNPVTGKFVIGKAYMTFIRGDRSVTQVSQSPTTTILREKGSFNLGNIAPISGGTATGQVVSVGNPYAAQVDFGLIKSSSTNIGNTYYYWDPKVGSFGAYQTLLYNTVTGTSSCSNCITGSSYANGNYNIQSGQGFFITTSGGPATVNFNENQKVDGSNLVSRVNAPLSLLRTTLYRVQNGVPSLYDGVLNIFDSNNSNEVDENDAAKIGNFNENLGLQREDKLLAIENRADIQETDTIFYKLGQVRLSTYRFAFTPENIVTNGLGAFLEDSYLNTSTPVSLSAVTDVDFVINSDAGSYAADRFRLVFKQLAPVPVTFVEVKAVKVNKDVNVSWKVENEVNINSYVVERSADGNAFTAIGSVLATGTSVYSLMDRQTLSGNNFYRIKSMGIAGDVKYSRVVKVTFEMEPAITMYPNPVGNDRIINLSFKDMPAGKYVAKVINSLGQIVMLKDISHMGTNAQYDFTLDRNLSHGKYSIEIVDVKTQKTILNFLY